MNMNYKPFNQVIYKNTLASITRIYDNLADILLIRSADDTEHCMGVACIDLVPIDISQNVLAKCKFGYKIPLGQRFSFECGKYKIDVFNNGCYTIFKEGNREIDGRVQYLHELQNIVREQINGHVIFI